MKLCQKVKDFVENPKNPERLNIALLFFNCVLATCLCLTPHPAKEHRKILPYEHGGFPPPFMTELVDEDRDGTPDRAFLHSIGPMFYNCQERELLQEEIDWYRSQK